MILRQKKILVASTYVPGGDEEILETELENLTRLIRQARRKTAEDIYVLIIGDFNRHDMLWGGTEVTHERQGEGTLIVDFIASQALTSLLPRGTKTWQRNNQESTIDLVLASTELTAALIRCAVHETDHGSDHNAIETMFDIDNPIKVVEPRLLFKNALWKAIKERIAINLARPQQEVTGRGGEKV